MPDEADLYDRSGEPISMMKYLMLFSDKRYQQVAYDEIGDYSISTVWLGIDFGFGVSDEPVIFETMIFGPSGALSQEQYRYTSETEALAGHAQLVAQAELLLPLER